MWLELLEGDALNDDSLEGILEQVGDDELLLAELLESLTEERRTMVAEALLLRRSRTLSWRWHREVYEAVHSATWPYKHLPPATQSHMD